MATPISMTAAENVIACAGIFLELTRCRVAGACPAPESV
jgi:hypothetical protein